MKSKRNFEIHFFFFILLLFNIIGLSIASWSRLCANQRTVMEGQITTIVMPLKPGRRNLPLENGIVSFSVPSKLATG